MIADHPIVAAALFELDPKNYGELDELQAALTISPYDSAQGLRLRFRWLAVELRDMLAKGRHPDLHEVTAIRNFLLGYVAACKRVYQEAKS